MTVRYGTKATDLITDHHGAVTGLRLRDEARTATKRCRPAPWCWARAASNGQPRVAHPLPGRRLKAAKVRGTRYNTGDAIRMALEAGAQPFGHWSGCHAVAWDLNAPPFGDLKVGDLFQKHSYPLGLIVNVEGQRFVDEGADFRNYTYARYGRTILAQPQRTAFQLFDGKVMTMLRDEYRIARVTKATSDTIAGLADGLGIDREGLVQTVDQYNAAVQAGEFNPAVLDGKGTRGITPPKSNWAQRLDTPPYTGFAVTCGITFRSAFGGAAHQRGHGPGARHRGHADSGPP